MISIDFSIGITIYIILVVNVALLVWLLGKGKQKYKDLSLDERFIWFCSMVSSILNSVMVYNSFT